MANQSGFMKATLYALKRNYGEPITLIQQSETQIDFDYGDIQSTNSEYTIRRAIRLPETSASNVQVGAEFRHFRFGSQVEVGEKQFIIDAKDLPASVTIKVADEIVAGTETFMVKSVVTLDNKIGYIITARNK